MNYLGQQQPQAVSTPNFAADPRFILSTMGAPAPVNTMQADTSNLGGDMRGKREAMMKQFSVNKAGATSPKKKTEQDDIYTDPAFKQQINDPKQTDASRSGGFGGNTQTSGMYA
jgi:hypothetical protein